MKRKNTRSLGARRERQLPAKITDDQRLSYRLSEVAALLGISDVSLWRLIKSSEIRVTNVGSIKLICALNCSASGSSNPFSTATKR